MTVLSTAMNPNTHSQENTETPPPQINTDQHQAIRYEAVLANIGDGLVVTDKKGIIITFNKAAEEMLGWGSNDAVGKHIQDVVVVEYVDDKSQSRLLGNMNTDVEAEAGKERSLFFVRKDKTKFPAALKVTSYVAGEEMLGTITLFRDITVETNADKIKSEFISLASHQLKTPLSTMRWYVSMLINGDAGKLSPDQLKFALNIKTATLRMIDMVSALLNISRIESGRINVSPVPTDLRTLISDVLQDVRQKIQQKNQKLEIYHANDLPVINIDPRLVSQIYLNLLTNASKYSPDNSTITLTLSLTEGYLLSQVADQGYGIPKVDREKVFDKFYRGDNVISKVSDGSGLGLYLVKAIVELSKGRIWFESHTKEECRPGEKEGTTFNFTLPLSGTPAHKGVTVLDGWDKT